MVLSRRAGSAVSHAGLLKFVLQRVPVIRSIHLETSSVRQRQASLLCGALHSMLPIARCMFSTANACLMPMQSVRSVMLKT